MLAVHSKCDRFGQCLVDSGDGTAIHKGLDTPRDTIIHICDCATQIGAHYAFRWNVLTSVFLRIEDLCVLVDLLEISFVINAFAS